MLPVEIRIAEQYSFVSRAVAGRRRLLEVGCGDAEVARKLAAAGFEITALDRDPHDRWTGGGVTYVARDFFDYEGGPFDAVLFTASLHHLAPVGVTLDRAAKLLVPGGVVAIDDFDLAAPNQAILDWYYRLQESLATAGRYGRDRIDPPGSDPLARWRDGHAEMPPLALGDEMLAEVEARFAVRELGRGPYLYRYICGGLAHDESELAAQILETERSSIDVGEFAPVGLRIVAERRQDPRPRAHAST